MQTLFGTVVRPLQGRGIADCPIPWVSPTAIHVPPLRGKHKTAGKMRIKDDDNFTLGHRMACRRQRCKPPPPLPSENQRPGCPPPPSPRPSPGCLPPPVSKRSRERGFGREWARAHPAATDVAHRQFRSLQSHSRWAQCGLITAKRQRFYPAIAGTPNLRCCAGADGCTITDVQSGCCPISGAGIRPRGDDDNGGVCLRCTTGSHRRPLRVRYAFRSAGIQSGG